MRLIIFNYTPHLCAVSGEMRAVVREGEFTLAYLSTSGWLDDWLTDWPAEENHTGLISPPQICVDPVGLITGSHAL